MLNSLSKRYLQGLPVFLAIADGASLTRAALTLGVSKAAVSQSLSQFEGVLKIRLFQRNTRGLSLTEAGLRLLEQTRGPMIALQEAAQNLEADAKTVQGELRITAPEVAFETMLLPALKRLHGEHPLLRVSVDLNDRFVDLVREGYDAGIRLSDAVEKDMVGRKLRNSSPCAVVASADYLKRRGAPKLPQDLLRHDCIGFQFKGDIVPWEFGRHPHVEAVKFVPVLAVNSLTGCIGAAREGIGLAYAMPRSLVENDLKSGALVEVLSGMPTPLPASMVYYSSRKHLPLKIKALLLALSPARPVQLAVDITT